MRKGLLGLLKRTLIDLQVKFISIILKKQGQSKREISKLRGKLNVARNNSRYCFQTNLYRLVFWDTASGYIPFPNIPTTFLPPLHLTPSAQHDLSEDFQTMPRGSHSLIFLKIPLSSPLLKNVWKADTKLEKRNKRGKKKRCTSGSEGGVTGSGRGLVSGGEGRQKQCESSALVAWAESLQVV